MRHGEVRREQGAASHGRGRGTGGGESTPSADEAYARPPCPLLCPDLAAPIARRGGAGRGFSRCLGRVADRNGTTVAFRHGRQ